MKRILATFALALACFMITCNVAYADVPLEVGRWINYGPADIAGLPANAYVRTVAADNNGRIWVGTDSQGIFMYNGSTWTQYTVANTAPNGLVSNEVERIVPIGNALWIATEAGVNTFNPDSNAWDTYVGGNLPNNHVFSIAQRVSTGGGPVVDLNTYYFGTNGGGLVGDCALIAGDPFNNITCDYALTEANSDLTSNFVYDIEASSDGSMWVAAFNGVNHIVNGNVTAYTPGNTPACAGLDFASDIAVDDVNGRIWVGLGNGIYGIEGITGKGACMLDLTTNTWHAFHSGNSGLLDHTVLDMDVDAEGRVWIATNDNMSTDFSIYLCSWVAGECWWKEYGTADGLPSDNITAVDANLDRIWFGASFNNAGINTFMPRWTAVTEQAQALADMDNSVWIGTPNGLKQLAYPAATTTTLIPTVNVQAILKIATNDVWVATLGAGLHHWNGSAWQQFTVANSDLASNALLALARDLTGRIWIGSEAAGVLVYDPVADSWTQFANAPFLPNNRVQSLAVGIAGDLWIGTANGLAHYTGSNWESVANASLPNTNIRALAVTELDHLWVGTANGVVRFIGTAGTSFTPANSGIPDGTSNTILLGEGNQVWLGTNAGAALYNGTTWTTYDELNAGLQNERVRAIAQHSEGHLWFGGINYNDGTNVAGEVALRSASTEPLGQPAPTITSFSPSAAIIQSVVTITGTHFAPDNIVEFSGAFGYAAADILTRSDVTMTVRVPTDAIFGTIRIRSGTRTATSAANFGPLPQITSFSPSEQIISGEIEILGTSLASPGFTEYRFGNSAYRSLNIIEERPGILRVRIPDDATSGPIRVRTPAGEAISNQNFILGNGGFTIFGYEVHQGLPQYPLVAGKSTVVRVFVGTNNPNGLCAYADRAVLQVLHDGTTDFYFANTANGGIINSGQFCNREKQVSKDGSIDFVIPGNTIDAGITYYMGVGTSMGFINHPSRDLGTYRFSRTNDIRIHASIPAWTNDTTQATALDQTMITQYRTYPVRDGWGAIGSENGMQIAMTNYPVCDGTATAYCGEGYAWDFWQQNPNGQLRACTIESTLDKGTDDGSVLRFDLGSFKAGQVDQRIFYARLRPGQTLPSDLRTLVNISGAPAGMEVILTNASTSIGTLRCGATTIPGVVGFVARFTNTTSGNLQATANFDYNETIVTLYGAGGIVAGTGNTVMTQLKMGQHWVGGGWLPSRHDAPFDENYNGVIDASDFAFTVVEFEDWNPANGTFSLATNANLINPGDLIRSFNDANNNNQHDSGEATSILLGRGKNAEALLWNIPNALMADYNANTDLDARFSGLLFMPGVNAYMGPGQGRCNDGCSKPGYQFWTNVTDSTVYGQELGHSIGMVHKGSPNFDGGSHTKTPRINYVPAGYNTLTREVVLGPDMLSIMHGNDRAPGKNSFFEPFEYNQVYTFLRSSASTQQVTVASPAAGELFYLAGTVSRDHTVTLDHSYIAQGIPLTPADPISEYVLRFMEGDESLVDHRFGISFEAYDHDHHDEVVETPLAVFNIVQPFPTDTTSIQIWHGSHLLIERAVSPNPPTVQLLAPNGGENIAANGNLTINWQGSDPDGDPLHYAVRYSTDNGGTWKTLGTAITNNQLVIPATTLAGSSTAIVRVEVTDGFKTAIDTSNGHFTVGKKGPQGVSIASPLAASATTYGVPIYLNGSALDMEDGLLSGNALVWSSDRDGALGTGSGISATLTVGTHVLTLNATDSDGMNASTNISVTILADFDNDGLSDLYEQAHSALQWWDPTDAGQDTDDDGLTNRSEAAWGTDPSNADTDGDGVEDGDEALAGSSPVDGSSLPAAQQFLISRTVLDYLIVEGTTSVITEVLALMTSTSQTVTWVANENLPWLTITPGNGATYGEMMVTMNVGDMTRGIYVGSITFAPSGLPSRVLPVRIEVVAPLTTDFPTRLPAVHR